MRWLYYTHSGVSLQIGINIGGYVRAIGGISAEFGGMPYPERFVRAEKSEIRCPDAAAAEKMCLCIDQIIHSKDTLGGLLEIVATGVPAGLGSFAQ